MFFGISDIGIAAAYSLSVLSALLCVIYGLYNWNKDGDDEVQQMAEEEKWEKAECQ